VLGGGPRYPWEGTDRDYKYEEVADFFSFLVKQGSLCMSLKGHQLY
jgi:hypothetical protein